MPASEGEEGIGSAAARSPYGEVLDMRWQATIEEGMLAGHAVELATYPLLTPEAKLFFQPMLSRGLGYDVFRLGDEWVLKVSADRHPDAQGPRFAEKQLDSYAFLRRYPGAEFTCQTHLFRCPIGGQQRTCEVQAFIRGRCLSRIRDVDLLASARLRDNLRLFVGRILEGVAAEGRTPDFWDTGWTRSARYTTNALVDDWDHPWLIDIGAWPEGFSLQGGLRATLRVRKITHDLRRFYSRLSAIDAQYSAA